MSLRLMPELFAICRLKADAALPSWLNYSGLSFVARTPDELSIICPEKLSLPQADVEKGWRCFKVEPAVEASLRTFRSAVIGILNQASIRTLAISTFKTDYVLLLDSDIARAKQLLTGAGHQIV